MLASDFCVFVLLFWFFSCVRVSIAGKPGISHYAGRVGIMTTLSSLRGEGHCKYQWIVLIFFATEAARDPSPAGVVVKRL